MDKKLNMKKSKRVFLLSISIMKSFIWMKPQNRTFPDVNSMHSAIKCCRRAKRPVLTAR